MVNILLSVPGKFYQDAITDALEQTGNFRVCSPEEKKSSFNREGPDDGLLGKAWEGAEIALLGISVQKGFTLGERKEVIRKLREEKPECRIVLFIDEVVSPEQTEGVKNLKQAKLIDGFLYASGTMDYLVATIESI